MNIKNKLNNIKISLLIASINLSIRLILCIFNFHVINFCARLIMLLLSILISKLIKSNLDNSCLTLTSLSSICFICCFIFPDIITFICFGFFFMETLKITLEEYTDIYYETYKKILFHIILIPILSLIALKSLSIYYGLFENLYNTEKAFYSIYLGSTLSEFEEIVPHSINVKENIFKGSQFSSNEFIVKAYFNFSKNYYITAQFKIRDNANINHLTSDDYICISKTLNYGGDIKNISSSTVNLNNLSQIEELVNKQSSKYFEENYNGYLENYVSSYEEYLTKSQIRLELFDLTIYSTGTTEKEWIDNSNTYKNIIFADTSGNYINVLVKNLEIQTINGYVDNEKISINAITPESLQNQD